MGPPSQSSNPPSHRPPDSSSNATTTAQTYYDSSDADTFYHTIWGGTDIHIGLYTSPSSSESIATASHRTIERMTTVLGPLNSTDHVLDLGSGYGGAARYLARTYGCKVTCLNLSEVENQRNRQLNKEAGLEDFIRVVQGSFESIPLKGNSVNVVWSQDAFLHSGARDVVVAEIARVLNPEGGRVIFTDPMAAEGADMKSLAPILKRLHLESLGSHGLYAKEFKSYAFDEVGFEDHTDQLVEHYSRVLRELKTREEELHEKISDQYVENMKTGLNHWIEGGRSGQLSWGIMRFGTRESLSRFLQS